MLEIISQNMLFFGSSAAMLAIIIGTQSIEQNAAPLESKSADRAPVVQQLGPKTPSAGGKTQHTTNPPVTTQQPTVSSPTTPTSSEITSTPAPTKPIPKQTTRRERHEDNDEEDDD